jgi:aryl-alcohol dehydrogenase-like predicted oxidoreductase
VLKDLGKQREWIGHGEMRISDQVMSTKELGPRASSEYAFEVSRFRALAVSVVRPMCPPLRPDYSPRMPPNQINAAAAGTWTIGDVTVNRIGFGTKRLAGSGPFDMRDAGHRERAVALLRRAVELGVNHIDTAEFYPTYADPERGATAFTGLHCANELVKLALAPYSDDLLIATKIGPTRAGLARPDQLRGLVEEDLRQLGRDRLDLVYLRQQGLNSIAEHFGALVELRDAGLIRQLGLSNVRIELLQEALSIAPVVAVQNRYGVDFGRVNDELVRFCGEQGIAFVPFFSLAGEAREAGGVRPSDCVADIARAHDVTPAQVRIAWTLSRGPHLLAIPGTSDPAHLAENVAAGTLQLSPEELATLG